MPLNSLVVIRARSAGTDASGTPVDAWADVCTVWAEIRHQSGVEAIKAGAEVSVVRASIKVRLRTDITAAMRVVHAGVQYDITAVLPDLVERQYMFLACEVAR